MFYTIYKITNKSNNKYYIGMHQTKNINDGYMGSGKLIKRAIQKYGIENFIKEIIYVFDNELDMRNKEKELVVLTEMSYNLCDGGKGGFGYINRNPNLYLTEKRLDSLKKGSVYLRTEEEQQRWFDNFKKSLDNPERIKKIKAGLKKHYETSAPHFSGKKHTEETKNKMRKPKNVGINNSQYGTCWITNGQENKKIKKEELDKYTELGYYKGRI